tara:strand:- start:330 stop:509 length:180 start_codon:yes stop_codon:yes gene_type:complete
MQKKQRRRLPGIGSPHERPSQATHSQKYGNEHHAKRNGANAKTNIQAHQQITNPKHQQR